jgi:eukaryotic-like serine/threonine-protein kinase
MLTNPSLFQRSAIASGLVSDEQFANAVGAAGAQPDDAKIARVLVRQGLLTNYQADMLRAGRAKLTLGPYLVTDFLGQGGMGQVFKAVHRVMGRQVAVKVLPLEKVTQESRDSFLREIRMQAGLDCPYLVRAYDAGQDGRVHYLVTEYVPGADLRQLVRVQGKLSMRRAAQILRQAALGLHYAHQQGLVHRDVKPGNILVTPDGRAKVSDVGMAAWATALSDDPRAGKIVGTADYLSPEQIRTPLQVGPATDIYSLGCTTYYAVCGKVPFPGGDGHSKLRRQCEETPWHPRRFNPELTDDFVDLIADMMEKDPRHRINAIEVADRFEPFADSEAASPSIVDTRWQSPSLIADEPPLLEPGTGESNPSSGTPSSSGSNVLSNGNPSIPPAMLQAWENQSPQPSSSMKVAVALAIAIPVCLFIGAVAGFLLHPYLTTPR